MTNNKPWIDPSFEHRQDRDLPEGWVYSALGNLGEWGTGGTPSKSRQDYWTNGVLPWVSPKDMKSSYISGARDQITELAAKTAAKLVPAGTILFVVRGMILAHTFPVGLTTKEVAFNQDMRSIVPFPGVHGPYLLRVLQHEAMCILFATKESTHGTRRLESDVLLPWPIPLPPLSEQRRIVEKVEALLDEVNRTKGRLERIRGILKRFRQSVLAAACSGRLTEEWRASHVTTPVDTRIRRLAQERLRLWESRHANRSRKYPASFVAEVPDGHEIPDTWTWVTISHLALLDVGFAFKSSEFGEAGVRLLRGENVEPGSLRWNETKYLPEAQVDRARHIFVHPGQIVLAMDRPLISSGLKIARVKESDAPALLVQRVMRFAMMDNADSDFLYLVLQHHRFVDFLRHDGMTGSDLPHITGTGVAEFPVPLPPAEEQVEIVKRATALLSLADAIERKVALAEKHAEKLPQAILSKAFSGELVLTEADLARAEGREYEPASVLLERIKKQGKAVEKPKKRGRRKADCD